MHGLAGSGRRSRGAVFLSYRRDDTAHLAGRLFDRLVEHFGRAKVFMDVDSLGYGDEVRAHILAAIGSSRLLLVLIGHRWNAARLHESDDFVALEIDTALQLGVPVIPVLVDGAALPPGRSLPPRLTPMLDRNAISLTHVRFGQDVKTLERVAGPFVSASHTSRRIVLIGGAVAATVTSGTIAALNMKPGGGTPDNTISPTATQSPATPTTAKAEDIPLPRTTAPPRGIALGPSSAIPVSGGTVFSGADVVVTQPTAGKFRAFSATCTHQGCKIRDVSDGTMNCPCHGSTFRIDSGAVASGPAQLGLAEREIAVQAGTIVVFY